ncbi:MAG: FAD-dependent thymidylate synthase [Gemmatimonadota bacterium]
MDDLPTSQPTRRPVSPSAEEILGGYFPVLDHGFVSLVDYMGTDEDVERAARVSYGYGTRKQSATRGLIRYLRRHRHTTPFEMVEFKFHCSMPMFVARQWIRHRTASVNEYSGRYSLMPLLFYTPGEDEFALQSDVNNQGRGEVAAQGIYDEAVNRWTRGREELQGSYEWMLEEDVARELARIDLPLSTYTQWYWKIDLHNLLHFLSLRADPHAQWEIREYARVMAGMVQRVAPLTFEAWLDYEFQGAHFSRGERAALAELVTPSPRGELLATDEGKSLSTGELEELGLSAREIRELAVKLQVPALPDFTLDLSTMRPGDEVGKEMAQAVPEVVKRKDAPTS